MSASSRSANSTRIRRLQATAIIAAALALTCACGLNSGHQIAVSYPPPPRVLVVRQDELRFRPTHVGQRSAPITLPIFWTDTRPYSVAVRVLSGGDFEVTDTCSRAALSASANSGRTSTSLPSSKTPLCELTVTFAPRSPGRRGTVLRLQPDLPGSAESSIPVEGIALP